jgi:lipopolysaccharide biosynthesis glycosyltransferase
MKTLHVAVASDKTYLNGAIGTLASLRLSLEKSVNLNVLYMHNGLEVNLKEQVQHSINRIKGKTAIEFVEIKEDFSKFPRFPGATQLTYARFLLPEITKSNQILYIDTDFLVLKNLNKICDIDLSDTGVAAVRDYLFPRIGLDFTKSCPIPVDTESSYFNAGFLVLDFMVINKIGIFKTALEYLNRFPEYCKYHDQSALNYALNGRYYEIDAKCNVQKYRSNLSPSKAIDLINSQDVCIHFVSPDKKPWAVYSNEPTETMFRILLDHVYPEWRSEKMREAKNRWHSQMRLAMFRPFIRKCKALFEAKLGKNPTANIKAAEIWSSINEEQIEIKKNKKRLKSLYSAWRLKINQNLV